MNQNYPVHAYVTLDKPRTLSKGIFFGDQEEAMSFIEVKSIRKKYGRSQILNGVNLEARPGEKIGIIGVNGCGKSTLLGIIAGSIKADSGEFLINGENALKNLSLLDRAIGYVPQDNPLMENLTVKDNLSFYYCDTGRNLTEDLQSGIPAYFGIPEFINKRVDTLSGGMKKRLSIACALAKNPPVLILDEPGASLDIVAKNDIVEYMDAYKRDGGTVIIASHEELELRNCDRIYLLKDGILSELDIERFQSAFSEGSFANIFTKDN